MDLDFSQSVLLIRKIRSYFPDSSNDIGDIENNLIKIIKLHPDKFSKKLKEIRQSKNISQVSIANYLHLSKSALSLWESGAAFPRLAKLKEWLQLLQVDPGELIDFNTEALKSTGEIFVPLLSLDFFEGNLTASGLETRLKKFSGEVIGCVQKDSVDFAVSVNHKYYNDIWFGSVNGSTLFCSTSILNDKKGIALYRFVSGKVILVKIIDDAASFRCARFNGQTLKLTPLNPYDDLREFPIGGVGDKPLDDANPASFRGWATSASSVRILAVVVKAVLSL